MIIIYITCIHLMYMHISCYLHLIRCTFFTCRLIYALINVSILLLRRLLIVDSYLTFICCLILLYNIVYDYLRTAAVELLSRIGIHHIRNPRPLHPPLNTTLPLQVQTFFYKYTLFVTFIY